MRAPKYPARTPVRVYCRRREEICWQLDGWRRASRSTALASILDGGYRGPGTAARHTFKARGPLTNKGWIYTEPGPYKPQGNAQSDEVQPIKIDLTSNQLPGPRPKPDAEGIVWVPAFTDLKLHDITSGPDDPNAEPLAQNQPAGTEAFFAGNRKFITRKRWGVGNSGPYMHYGKFTTMREAILAHSGEALQSREAFQNLTSYDRDCIIEFLKSLRILPPGTTSLMVDEHGNSRN
jgi:Di-haem oxidoreductase, putative peroxidase